MRQSTTLIAFACAIVVFVASCGSDSDECDPGIVSTCSATLTVVGGSGTGRVRSTPPGIDCRISGGVASAAGCSATFEKGVSVTLTAEADADQLFKAWSGVACTDSATCQLKLADNTSVTATFVPKGALLSLRFVTQAADDGAAIIVISGAPISAVTPVSGLQLAYRTRASDGKTVVLIRGLLTTGPVAQVLVSGLDAEKPLTAVVEQVAARATGNYAQRTNLSSYGASVQ